MSLLKIGHRGARGYAPENTLKSFNKALEFGVDMVELDVHCSKDNQVVVIHDRHLNRTTSGTGLVNDFTYNELAQYDAGEGEKIPALTQVIECIDNRCTINIEIKDGKAVKPMAELINNYFKQNKLTPAELLISSSNHHWLLNFKKLIPQIEIAPILEGVLFDYSAFAKKLPTKTLSLAFDFLPPEYVINAHEHGFKVYAWVVNEKNDLQEAIQLGLDGVFTDYPDLF